MDSPWFWLIIGLSYIGTLFCWRRVYLSRAPMVWKFAGVIVSAIPIGGPFFFLLIDAPPRVPQDAQAKLGWRTGTTLYTEIRRDLFAGNRRYIASMFGTRVIDGSSPNRESRREKTNQPKTKRKGT